MTETGDDNFLKFKLDKFLLFLILVGLSLSSINYAVTDYTSLSFLARPLRFLLSVIIGAVFVINLFYIKKLVINKSILFYLLLLFILLFFSLILNSPSEYIPSSVRYVCYLLAANSIFFFIEKNGIHLFKRYLKLSVNVFLWISLLFGYFEILSGRVDFINGDFRVAGPFRKHQLAYAIFLLANLILYIEFELKVRTSHTRKIYQIILFILNFYLFIRTGSRAFLVIFFLTYFALFVLNSKSFKSLLKTVIMGVIVFSMLILVVVNTNISPRLKTVFTSSNTIYDPSTMERILIITTSVEEFSKGNMFVGIGLGGFNNYYRSITGEDGVAAHNNYLLFFIEGGYLGIFIFLLYQVFTFTLLLKSFRKSNNAFTRSALLLFVGIDVLGFLQNNYYFFTTEIIVWAIYGSSFYNLAVDEKEKDIGIRR